MDWNIGPKYWSGLKLQMYLQSMIFFYYYHIKSVECLMKKINNNKELEMILTII